MTTLLQLIEKSGMNRNQVSKISGISNTFLTKLERFEASGEKIKIKRKNLINLAVSLNLNLVEINSMLKEYRHEKISASDTPHFLAASETKTVTGIIPLFSSLAQEWFLIGMEKELSNTEGAFLEWVLDQPTHALKSPEYASFTNRLDSNTDNIQTVHKDLVTSACAHRRKLITEALERGNCISTYICHGCFERYVKRWEQYNGADIEGNHKNFIEEHLETLIKYIETYPDHYKLRFLKKCHRLNYELLYIPFQSEKGVIENKASNVLFFTTDTECNRRTGTRIPGINSNNGFGQGFGDMIGFVSDKQNLIDFFHKQHIGLKEHFVDDQLLDPKRIVEHIKELMSKNIPGND